MAETVFYPRHVEPRLGEALEDSPVVLIHGPRQCGKTTLARLRTPSHLGQGDACPVSGGRRPARRDYAYVTFDDATARNAAQADPAGFVSDQPERVILDEDRPSGHMQATRRHPASVRQTFGR